MVAVLLGSGVAAWAFLTTSAAPGSAGRSAATSVNGGATPSASVSGSVSREVTISWGVSTLANGHAVEGYLVQRWQSVSGSPTGAPDISPVGTCSGTVTALTCTDDDVPPGAWQYTITPVIGTNWRGSASAASGVVTIGQAMLTVDGSPFDNAAFTGVTPTANATGAITGFSGTGTGGHGEGVGYRLDSGPGTTLTGSPSFVGTNGTATITSLGIPKSAGDGAHTVYALGDAAYYPSQATAGIVIDTTPPTVTAQVSPTPNSAGWNDSDVSVSLVADDGTGSGVDQIRYTTDGSTPTSSHGTVYAGTPISITTEGTTLVQYIATDVAGNASTASGTSVKLDKTPPTNSISQNVLSGNALLTGTTLYYRGASAGSFTLTNGVGDALSGPASSNFSPLAGTSTGWSFASSSVTSPSGGPYASNAFSWSAGTSSSPTETVTGFDVAANSTATSPAITFTNDSAGPTGGSVDATGLVGTGSRYSNSKTLSVALAKGTDGGVGLAAGGTQLLRAEGTLSSSDGVVNGLCTAYGSFAPVATDPATPYSDTVPDDDACYMYEYLVSDKLGNTTTYTSGDIKVETSAPNSLMPNPSLANATGNTFISGTTAYINAQSGKSGSFQVSVGPTDGFSGVLNVVFPALAGFSAPNGGTVSASPFQKTYSWSGAVGASGSQSVTANDNATLGKTAVFTVTPDTSPPSGGALTVNGTAADGTGTSSSWSGTGSYSISAITDYTDAGSGLASSTLVREQGTLASSNGIAAGTCGSTWTSPTTIGSRSTSISQSLTGPACYRYTLTGTDNVGNATSISTTVKVDTTGPSTPSVSLSSATGNTFISGSTAYINPQAGKAGGFTATATSTDIDSGIQKVVFPTAGSLGFTGGGGDVTGSPYTTTYAWSGAGASGSGAQSVTSFNNSALSASNSSAFTITADTTAPSAGAVKVNGVDASSGGSSSYSSTTSFTINSRTDYTDGGSGLKTSILTVQSFALSSSDGVAAGTCAGTASGPFSTATTITNTTQPSGFLTGFCYVYTLTGTDNVGNLASVSTTVKVDTSPPSAPTVTPSAATGNTFVNGTTVFINPQSGKSGGFTVTASGMSDSQSGIQKVNLPSLTGFTSGGADVTSSPYATTYAWSGAVGASGPQAVTAFNNSGLTGAANFTVTPDTTAPINGAVTVNGTAASAVGTTSSINNSTSFPITGRTDYSDGGSGLASSVLTVQSETLSGSTCGALGSGGPFTSATTISGTAQPGGIVAGFCYVYTLKGTDNVGNTASISTTVVDNALSFTVTTQPSSVTAGTATASNAVVITAVKNGQTDTGFTGTLSWSGANNSPSGASPTLPTSPTWTNGVATFGITLVKAESETLTATADANHTANLTAITVNAGAAAKLAWTSISTNSPGTPNPNPCYFACSYASGFGNNSTWTAKVSITDSVGNVVSNVGSGHNVVVTLGGSGNGSMTPTSPATLTMPASGTATTTTTITFTGGNGSSWTNTLTATSSGFTNATASFSK